MSYKQKKLSTSLSVDGCSEKASEFSTPGYQLKPSERSKRNWSIKAHRGMVEKCKLNKFESLASNAEKSSQPGIENCGEKISSVQSSQLLLEVFSWKIKYCGRWLLVVENLLR